MPIKTVLLYDYTPTLNKIRKDFKKINKKLFLNKLATLLLINIIIRADLDSAVKEIIKAI
jgi:hypothetical protein